MTEYQTHAALVATLEAEVTRLRAVNAELRASISRQVQVDTNQEPAAFLQFLSDVVTAAGLLSHGRQSKALAERIAEAAMQYRKAHGIGGEA